jgi:NAD(P)-dependent dehydrogenase (short-subunit alcohol dehydrogenase family)
MDVIFYFLNSLVFKISLIFIALYTIRKLFLLGTFTNLKQNMKGKVILVTGSSSGIGKATALQLLNDGANVIFACRDDIKAKEIFAGFNSEQIERAHYIKFDLGSFKSVHNLAEEFSQKYSTLDILINNAAIFPGHFKITEDNIEESLQINTMGHILLTTLLLDKFNKNGAKIINLTSFAHVQSYLTVNKVEEMIRDDKFTGIENEFFWNMWMKHHHYSNTKLGNIYFAQHLAEYAQDKHPHIKVVAVNPGLVYTEIARFVYTSKITAVIYNIFFFMHWYISKTPMGGAQTPLHCCYLDFNEMVSGGYYSDCKLKSCSRLASNKDVRDCFMKYLAINFKKSDFLKSHEFTTHELLFK